jgi:hypothetical protein
VGCSGFSDSWSSRPVAPRPTEHAPIGREDHQATLAERRRGTAECRDRQRPWLDNQPVEQLELDRGRRHRRNGLHPERSACRRGGRAGVALVWRRSRTDRGSNLRSRDPAPSRLSTVPVTTVAAFNKASPPDCHIRRPGGVAGMRRIRRSRNRQAKDFADDHDRRIRALRGTARRRDANGDCRRRRRTHSSRAPRRRCAC